MSQPHFKLISHKLCPYVQRSVIALKEKGISYERVDIDLENKPEWFLKLSPLGKVPLMVVSNTVGAETSVDPIVLFESAVISEYIDTVTGGDLLSTEPLKRAQQRAWIEFASGLINNIGQFYNAATTKEYYSALEQLGQKWQRLEEKLPPGAYFEGDHFSLVDASFAPALRYLDVFEALTQKPFLNAYPKVQNWRAALSRRNSVRDAVTADYPEALTHFLAKRDSIVGRLARKSINEQPTAVGF